MRVRMSCLVMCLVLPAFAAAEDEAKELSGISVVGNDEAPKSLYIVPWKSSEIGVESGLSSNLMNDGMGPVDKEVFMRQLDFYETSSQE
ncbi:hypothetical protein [Thiohalomonas denitrificans]|uniref:Uncharacterized protein n=1 Tax=Thiohalomonas denitrificans TaxID=415747 RepID=A0A1G5QST0_9GAMM|nr:hypothetical protein [Thiohalomonas denitrificans]SCZ64628.1 hypothetical protein SAMN03097708_02675 [Thiohalomonas denitrificans]